MSEYTPQFYEVITNGSRASARRVVPRVVELLQPRSVIDLGCGVGDWLATFAEAGLEIQGVDGEYVDRCQLAIPEAAFASHDLTQPYHGTRRYDLAMSVEVAEHLTAACAAPFVDSLTALAPVVLFSAAIPHQGGTHHVNCQWPQYWAELFAARGFELIDTLRYDLWDDAAIEWWYRQNLVLYATPEAIVRQPKLAELRRRSPPRALPLVHPEMLEAMVHWGMGLEQLYQEALTGRHSH